MGVKPAYSIRSLTHTYDGGVVLDIPALDIPAGQISIFTGPNGSGKTTLLSILALLQAPSGGSCHLNGMDCIRDPGRELRRMVTLVHQKPVLFSASVRGNLVYGLKTRGLAAKEVDRRVKTITDEMQLSTVIDKHARKLSGGEAQRVILARALILETPILLLDEPTNSLDDACRPVLVELLHNIRQTRGATVVIATHDTNFISALSGRILRMEGGKILGATDA
jgi:tungstate transport system ATP-binding protein